MIVQFSDLLAKKSRKKEINLSFELEPFIFEGDEINAVEPAVVDGYIISSDDVLILQAKITTKLQVSCARCLDTFIYPIDIDIEERFTNNEELLDGEEIVFVEGDSLDITLIVENSIISTLPIKRLCDENCKGLCADCGKNLNVEICGCNTADVDIRLAKLKELFGE